MDEQVEAAVTLLKPLLRALEMLMFVSRYLNPPDFADVMASVGTPDNDLKVARESQTALDQFSDIVGPLNAASDAALAAFAGLREVLEGSGDIVGIYRALRFLPRGLEALYPLANSLPPVNRFFLDPSFRSDVAFQQLFLQPPAYDKVGVMRFADSDNERGGFWLYVPENYQPDRAWPLVMALHGGSGTGRQFLWSWLRDARSRGAILAAPTSVQGTWALTGPDVDSPNLTRILELIRSGWNIDPARLLLTGMSDGGTFSYVSGLEAESPFTHLAPVSAAFHPMLAEMADADRLRGLPIHIIHGALDWMFSVDVARQANLALARAGALVTYLEVDDLSHCYPRELNGTLLNWLGTTQRRSVAPHSPRD
jgi:phospholipase/carboxylesterase